MMTTLVDMGASGCAGMGRLIALLKTLDLYRNWVAYRMITNCCNQNSAIIDVRIKNYDGLEQPTSAYNRIQHNPRNAAECGVLRPRRKKIRLVCYSRFLNDRWVVPTLVYVVIWLYLDSSIPSRFAELTSAHSSVSTSLAAC